VVIYAGVNGIRRGATPVASKTAAATAGGATAFGASPPPPTPQRPNPSAQPVRSQSAAIATCHLLRSSRLAGRDSRRVFDLRLRGPCGMVLLRFRARSAHVVPLGSVSAAKDCCEPAPHCCERRTELSHAGIAGMRNAWFLCHRCLRSIDAKDAPSR